MAQFLSSHTYIIWMIIRALLATVIGAVIGTERANHGKDAGVRTHVLVCLGAALTSMISIFGGTVLHINGDLFRIPAQVISGIGFLGAGMIFMHSNRAITNLTTAAGIWTTGVIGIALGYGFYSGAFLVAAISFLIIKFSTKIEKSKNEIGIYIEIDDMSKSNHVIKILNEKFNNNLCCKLIQPLSGCSGHIGITFHINKNVVINTEELLEEPNILFITTEF